MGSKTFSRSDIIFRQGDPGDCMYDIQFGTVEIYVNYGGDNEKKIAELSAGDIFGEMSILDSSPRSATAVAGTDSTELMTITKDSFVSFFMHEPVKILTLMQQMIGNIGSMVRAKYDMIGRNVNLASRIQGYTRGGQILVSNETLAAAGAKVLENEAGAIIVSPKGIHEDIMLHDIIGFGSQRL